MPLPRPLPRIDSEPTIRAKDYEIGLDAYGQLTGLSPYTVTTHC